MSKQVRDIVLLKELVRNNYHGWQFIIQIAMNYDIKMKKAKTDL